ncbi:MAG TPA: hypothetical protein VGL94_19840 [Ktedonobacteraceae bacterium]|jgi:hypothetical protein
MNPTVRRVIILGTPAVLGILDLFHPTFSGDVFDAVSPRLNWWITLHFLQLPLFCLLALSVYLLLDGVHGMVATLSKVALGIFVIFYPALDAILGIGTGALVSYGQGMAGLPQILTASAIENSFSSSIVLLVGVLGSFGWVIAILLAVLALSRPIQSRWFVIVTLVLAALAISYYQLVRINLIPEILPIDNLSRLVLLLAIALGLLVRPRLAAGLLVMAAYLFSVDHAPPTGPIAMACYFVAALQLEFSRENAPLVKQDVAPVEKDVLPANEDVVSAEDVVPAEENATTTEKDAIPAEQDLISAEQDAVPVEQDVVPDPS